MSPPVKPTELLSVDKVDKEIVLAYYAAFGAYCAGEASAADDCSSLSMGDVVSDVSDPTGSPSVGSSVSTGKARRRYLYRQRKRRERADSRASSRVTFTVDDSVAASGEKGCYNSLLTNKADKPYMTFRSLLELPASEFRTSAELDVLSVCRVARGCYHVADKGVPVQDCFSSLARRGSFLPGSVGAHFSKMPASRVADALQLDDVLGMPLAREAQFTAVVFLTRLDYDTVRAISLLTHEPGAKVALVVPDISSLTRSLSAAFMREASSMSTSDLYDYYVHGDPDGSSIDASARRLFSYNDIAVSCLPARVVAAAAERLVQCRLFEVRANTSAVTLITGASWCAADISDGVLCPNPIFSVLGPDVWEGYVERSSAVLAELRSGDFPGKKTQDRERWMDQVITRLAGMSLVVETRTWDSVAPLLHRIPGLGFSPEVGRTAFRTLAAPVMISDLDSDHVCTHDSSVYDFPTERFHGAMSRRAARDSLTSDQYQRGYGLLLYRYADALELVDWHVKLRRSAIRGMRSRD